MAKARQTVTIKTRTRKSGNGYSQCNMCHGTGKIKKRGKK